MDLESDMEAYQNLKNRYDFYLNDNNNNTNEIFIL